MSLPHRAPDGIHVDRPLVLGSGSPRRRDILSALGIPFVSCPADVDEEVRPGELPEPYLRRVTSTKLGAVQALRAERHPTAVGHQAILVADTIVVLADAIVGKPDGVEGACATLARLVGRKHVVMTRYAVAPPGGAADATLCRTVRSEVEMREASAEEIRRYAATGEGLDKAGAYAVQGVGAFLVRGIVGSYTNVVGLPACELVGDLQRAGLLVDFPPTSPPAP